MKHHHSQSTILISLTCIILMGAFSRFYQLHTLPPGDGFDPAYYGLDALRIINGEYPLYFATNYGREALFSYLVAIIYAVIDRGTVGIHLASAYVSLLTIPAVFLVANAFFKQEKRGVLSKWGGITAALILALSFWHLMWSRYSVRVILIPLFISLLCFFLLRALHTKKQRYFLLTGIIMGVGFYTYQLAQLFPILVGFGVMYDMVARRSITKKESQDIAVMYGVTFIIALPLIWYTYQNPNVFNQRIGDVFVLKDTNSLSGHIKILSESVWDVIKMYTIEGDSDSLINIPKRPSLNPFLSIALLAGIGISLYRWRHPRYLFLLTWFGLMSAPAFLAEKAAMSKRALGALPAAILLITLALLLPAEWLWRRSQTESGKRWPAIVYTSFVLLGLVFSGFTTFQDYFLTWGKNPNLYTHYNVGVAEIGEFISTLPEADTIYLSPTWIEHSTLRLHADNREGIRAYNGRHCFVYPERTTAVSTYIIVPADEQNSLPLVQTAFPNGQISYEEQYYTSYHIPADSPAQLAPQQPLYTNWDDELSLIGYDISGDKFKAGDSITINLYYQPLTDMSSNYTAFIHLLGAADSETGNTVWGQVDREPCFQSYPTSWWQDGEIIRDTYTLIINPEAAPGNYEMAMGFYRWPELTRLNAVESTHETDNQAVILQPIEILP